MAYVLAEYSPRRQGGGRKSCQICVRALLFNAGGNKPWSTLRYEVLQTFSLVFCLQSASPPPTPLAWHRPMRVVVLVCLLVSCYLSLALAEQWLATSVWATALRPSRC